MIPCYCKLSTYNNIILAIVMYNIWLILYGRIGDIYDVFGVLSMLLEVHGGKS